MAEIEIKKENWYYRIINSYEQFLKENGNELKNLYKNEKEIKDNIEIEINDKKMLFCYYYKFMKKGKYKIKYILKNKNLNKLNHILSGCSFLTNIDLSYFNTQNVTNMSYMFSGYSSLTNIDLSNFNTQNFIVMSSIFNECSSLTNIDLLILILKMLLIWVLYSINAHY